MANDIINSSNLSLVTITGNVGLSSPEYENMLIHIEQHLPAIQADSQNFYKSHSQFMGVTLDVTALTPVRRIKHVLAEIDRTRAALEEAYINRRKKEIELRRKQDELDRGVFDEFDRELLEVEVIELQCNLKNIGNAVQGAIRKMSFFTTQYDNLLKSIGKDHITEEDYEKEEDRYHIMTAMKQALCAARARGGSIDEGNHIYLFDMGINGAVAQAEITAFLDMEQDFILRGVEPRHDLVTAWLEAVADRFAGYARKAATEKGYSVFDEKSTVKRLE